MKGKKAVAKISLVAFVLALITSLILFSHSSFSINKDLDPTVRMNATSVKECIEKDAAGTCTLSALQASDDTREDLLWTQDSNTRLNTTHNNFTIPAGATIDSAQVCFEGYSDSTLGNNANDRCGVYVGENSTGTINWYNISGPDRATCQANGLNGNGGTGADKTNCWNATTYLTTRAKANNALIGIYIRDSNNNNKITNIDYLYIEVNYTLDSAPPTYSSNASQLVTTYASNSYSNFSVTWNDNSGSLSGAYLEANFAGSLQNITMSGSYPTYTYNTTALPAGTYQYRFVANDSQGNSNGTAVLTFTISKRILAGSSSSPTVVYPTSLTATGTETNTGDSDVVYQEWCGNTLMTQTTDGNPSGSVLLAAGLYTCKLNTTGATFANYTANATIATSSGTVSQNSTNPVNIFFINSTGTYQNQNMTVNTGSQTTANVTAVYTQSGTVALYEGGASVSNNVPTILSIGTHSYKGNITGNANYTSNNTGATYYIIVLDNVPPNIQLNSPANNFNSSNAQQTFNFTATDNYAASMNCNLTVDGSVVNSSVATNATPKTFVNILSEGTRQWNVSCADSFNNLNTSETRTITVDITKPFVSIISPTNISYNTTTLNLNYSSSDLHLQTVWYQYSNANTTLNGNITFTALDNQVSTLTLFANDTAGNINSTSVTFTVDTTKPTINLNLPADGVTNLQRNLTFNFTATDNLAGTMSCSLYIDNILNQTNSSTFNNTLTNFFVNGITEDLHYWNVSCTDIAGNANFSTTRSFIVNVTPILASISASPNPIKGGNVVTITASGIDDPNSDALNLYCSESSTTPNSTNTICTGGNTVSPTKPYTLTCTYAVASDDNTHTTYCRAFDGAYYSNVTNTTFTTDSTPPTTSIISVAGSPGPTFYDTANDGWTNMTLSGEANMLCRWGTSNIPYSSMSNGCAISGTQATCSAVTTIEGIHYYNFYTSCRDSLGNEQNSDTNLAITNLIIDWNAPTTYDNSSSAFQVPPYTVGITEQDNLPYGTANIITKYCIDATDTCTPNTLIDSGQTVTFTSANRGTNHFRYNSSDPAANVQSIQNKTININQLPIFTSASDNATTIRGGSGVLITTVSSEPDAGQTLKLFVCNSTSVSASGCGHSTYCSNTATTNASCSFASETDDAMHTWYAFVYDSLNEAATTNSSDSYTTVITPPAITIINPTNTTYTQNSAGAQIELSKVGSWAGYSLDGATNVTMSNSTPTFWSATISSLSDGTHTIKFYANDSYGNTGTNVVIFFVDTTLADTTPPSITVTSPSNNSYQTTSVWLNITTDENAFTTTYSLDGAANVTMSNSSLTAWYAELAPADESLHNVVVYATDTSTNRNEGRTDVSFYVDTQAPRYSNAAADPNPANETQNITCSALWTDGLNISTALIGENSTGVYENHTVSISGTSGWANLTIIGSSLSVGAYQCIFYSSDAAGNFNSTDVNFLVQDVTVPTITIRYPLNTNYTQNSVTAEILGSENLNWAGYFLDGAANVTLGSISGTLWSSTVSDLVNGTHTMQFYGNDSSSNMGESSLRFFTIDTTLADTTPPSITVTSPSNNSYQTTSVWLNITTDENAFTTTYSLDGAANVTMSNSSLTAWYAQLSLSDESLHNVVVYATDASTNRNEGRSDISFYVDTKAPRYSQVSTNVSVANVSQSVKCSSYWEDGLNVNSGKVSENSTGSFSNHTITISGSTAWVNYTIPENVLAVGTYSCIFYAYDSAGNLNSTSTSFTVQDITPPTIIINAPSNNTYRQTFVDASITASKNIKHAEYSLDGAANVTMSNSSLTIWSSTITDLSNSAHMLTFYATDFYDNAGTNNLNFTVDTTVYDTNPPVITVFSPTNKTFTYDSILLNITLSKAGSNASYSLDNAANISLGNVSTTNWNKTITLSQGTHSIIFFANDTSTNRNTGNSSSIYFTIDTHAPQNSTQGYTPSPANQTVDVTCYALWTDNVALDYGIIQHNETGTASNTSQIPLSGNSGWTNLTISSSALSPGLVECKAYAFDKGGLANSTSIIISIADAIAPKVENISYIPNTTAEIDPNVLINVTADVNDNITVSKVILQYKQTNATSWTNQTMSLISGNTYGGNFTPSEGSWSFRVFANDSSNNINISSITNVSAEFDTTWINVSTIPAIKSIVKTQPRFFALGNLTINNTGDYDLNFTVDSSQNWISFNGTGNNSIIFRVNQSMNASLINVTANTTGFATGEYNFDIIIYAFTLNSTIVSTQTIPGKVVIQNVAGPFFTVSITVYGAAVKQGDTRIVLTSTLSNDGTSDATDTWLAWSMPSGWTNTSGELNKSIGFLGIGSTVTNNITVSVDSSAATGSFSLVASATSAEGATGSDSKTVTVGSPSPAQVVQNVVNAGGGTSAAGMVESLLSKGEILTTSETIDLFRGQENSFTVDVKNIFARTTLNNVSLKIEGLLPKYVEVSPNIIDSIDYNGTKQFNVTITSPEYVETGSAELTVIIEGKIVGVGVLKDFTETRKISFLRHIITQEETNQIISTAESYLDEMKDSGFPTTKLSQLLADAQSDFDKHDYEGAKDVVDKIKTEKEAAFEANKLLEQIKNNINNYNSITARIISITGRFSFITQTFSETENIVNLAKAAFEREDYLTALQRAKDAQLTLALEKNQGNILFFIVDNWLSIALSIIFFSAIGIYGVQLYVKSMISERIKNLEKEESNIKKLMIDAQKKHYKKGSIGMETFNTIMSQYTKRLSKIRQLRIRLRHRRVRLLKSSELLKDLDEERKDVINMLKKLQNDYFVERKISKDAYNEETKTYNDRLSEIEDDQLTLETMLARKGNFERKIVKQLKKNGKNLGKNQVEKLFSKIKEGRVWSRKSKR